MPSLSSADVVETAGVTYRQLDYWARRGYVRPLPRDPGQGYPRHWDEAEVDVVRIMAALVRDGYRVPVAARRARGLVS